MTDETIQVATEEERQAAHRRIVERVLDEMKRVVIAINIDGVLQTRPPLALRFGRGTHAGGPMLVIDDEDLGSLAIAILLDLIGPDLDVELSEGRIVVFSPSWSPDRIPF